MLRMPGLNWTNLRPWRGSQHTAFEELCCQLAAHESAPVGAQFRRVGAPDAGVECVWHDPTGGDRGWQAKFFLAPLGPGEWRQLDESITRALNAYPNLVSYTICLPIDRPDARLRNQQSMMARWNARVERWTDQAHALGRSVTFYYWGESEIAERLARREHAGRAYFWFTSDVLGPEWFTKRFSIARANAGPRYSPELHVGLPISDVFDGLARNPRFAKRIRRQWGNVRREVGRALPPSVRRGRDMPASTGGRTVRNDDSSSVPRTSDLESRTSADRVHATATRVRELLDRIGNMLPQLEMAPTRRLPLTELDTEAVALGEALGELTEAFEEARELASIPADENAIQIESKSAGSYAGNLPFEYERAAVWRSRAELRDFRTLLKDDGAAVANDPALLITGDAGTGKTHLFCDIANRAVTRGDPCVLLLGQQLTRADPWKQMCDQLQLDCPTADQFLGALTAAAEVSGRRALLLIDALNEGDGRHLWRHQLAGVLTTIAAYPWVAVGLSVRTSYEPVVIPDAASFTLRRV